ncbi:MAG: hypothetical protein DRO89_02710 [Candidatus Altiarchaeales archaeon]|nr:MAG: hypothetical protein DRO89_02710 [Candidatus Altiarchaeales archaeon]
MIKASPYVIRNMSRVLEKKDLIETREVFEKFLTRYKEDRELQRICDDFMEYISTRDREILSRIRSRLEKLRDTRRLESSGGTGLWYGNRRSGIMQWVVVM